LSCSGSLEAWIARIAESMCSGFTAFVPTVPPLHAQYKLDLLKV
jgi:hypothetical protein